MRPPVLLLAVALAACGGAEDDQPLDVSVIGPPARLADRGKAVLSAPAAYLADATAQGLVAFDAAGQIEPALAERWIVSDEGRSVIFRLGERRWPDGSRVTTREIARALRRAIAPGRPLSPITGAIEAIVAVTPEVIDVRLRSPRPNLLQLLAQPEFAMLRGSRGAGPFDAAESNGLVTLTPRPVTEGERAPPPVRLRGERAALAVARFRAGDADGVFGGTFADLPIARVGSRPAGELRFDSAPGLFGLAFVPAGGGFTARATNRRALAMAVDRDALLALFAVPGWAAVARVVGGEVDDLPRPARPDWEGQPLDLRRTQAAEAVALWRGTADAPEVRVALPAGPGARLLFTRLAIDWRAIGVVAVRVGVDQPADLRLVDAVAPGEIASWYLRRFACAMKVPCSRAADVALVAARNAPTLPERAVLLAEADRLIGETVPFVPLARPLRWSLVGSRLTGWRESPRAFHPLRHLRAAR